MKKELMLYIHIPFCVKKCAYCDFLSGPAKDEEIIEYVNALCMEIESYQEMSKEYLVDSIFFGGGTPSILEETQITQIITSIRNVFEIKQEAEITIECNPGTVTKQKLSTYKSLGINRLSFGLQSTDNEELKKLGRIHTYEEFLNNFHLARELGFNNINVDIMSALPGQTLESYCKTLNEIIQINPEHISAYSLILEEDTPFYKMYGEDGKYKDLIPSEEVDRLMYHETKRLLKAAGYERYEISNYAKEGYACRHNVGYWKRREYLGIGLGASSLINGERYHIDNELTNYLEGCRNPLGLRKDIQRLTKKEEIEEFMFLGLRLVEGIKKSEFNNIFHEKIEDIYQNEISKLSDENLIEVDKEKIYLTELGFDLSNQVFTEFLLDEDE
ncbi:radical SAM family heme chaperone HemW [Clostridium sp. Marseille-P299]|uniref:radical SAM family heme chaperone HemW n=1 Tax=Clostridium sp. Marseille-P299 TaxID=1805477 RepID=UPI000831F2B8|nr:radical SAM family heme chaperone HemW [Clostridium sp. Marseille-P299]